MKTEPCPKIYLYKRIVQAKLFIDAHFSENIDLSNIADEAHFSKFHFIRLFKTMYGKTPHQYLIKVRIDNAKMCLQKGVSVTETCLLVGFDSAGSFATLFKQYTRLSPSVYQQQYQKRKELMNTAPLQFVPACFAEHNGWKQLPGKPEKSNFKEVI